MKTLAIAAIAVSMSVLPATAQQSGQASANQNASKSQQASAQQSDSRHNAMSQQKLRKSLQDAGFKDVNIVDAAYIVHAKTDDGKMVVMYIDPPIGVSGNTANTTGSTANTDSPGSTNAASGSKSSK